MKKRKNVIILLGIGICMIGFIGIGLAIRKNQETKSSVLVPTEIPEEPITFIQTPTEPLEEPITPEPTPTKELEEPITPEPTSTKKLEEPITPEPIPTKELEEPITPEPTPTKELEEPITPEPILTETEEEPTVPEPTPSTTKPSTPPEKPTTKEPIDNKEEKPSYDSSVPTTDQESHAGQVYDSVFGWITPSKVEQDIIDSDGDINKQVGSMGGN